MPDDNIPANEAPIPEMGERPQRKPSKHIENYEPTYLGRVKVKHMRTSKYLDFSTAGAAVIRNIHDTNGPIWERWAIPDLDVYGFRNAANGGWLVYTGDGRGGTLKVLFGDEYRLGQNDWAAWQYIPSGSAVRLQLYDDPDVAHVVSTVVTIHERGLDNMQLWEIKDE